MAASIPICILEKNRCIGKAPFTESHESRVACAQAMSLWLNAFGLACEFHRDWRNDVEGLATLFSNHIPDYRNLMTSYNTLTNSK
ncbi:hypothetical protein HK44_000310 [Pseudomonas fluorescens HK44]|uniref:Uncharacterized protein n=1 Tax=Pseudomonas fluorescens HK44 TaxID=1042209 RepID=A0A010TAX8_PSEFL|nr:hypothetical protein HK44_000310 [Pseudomonas fluorescens HK44]